MRYIKTYENKIKRKFNVGDYVLIDLTLIDIEAYNNPIAYIEDYIVENKLFPYLVIFIDKDEQNESYELNISENEIIRKATADEIEKVKLLKYQNKYNL